MAATMTAAVLRRRLLSSSTFSSILRRGSSKASPYRLYSSSEGLVPVDKEETEHVQRKIWEESHLEEQPNKFIPVTRLMLVSALADDKKLLSPEERAKIKELSASLDACILQQFYSQLEELKVWNHSSI